MVIRWIKSNFGYKVTWILSSDGDTDGVRNAVYTCNCDLIEKDDMIEKSAIEWMSCNLFTWGANETGTPSLSQSCA
jgi:hypothetical protein